MQSSGCVISTRKLCNHLGLLSPPGSYVIIRVCGRMRVFGCEHDNSKNTKRFYTKFCPYVSKTKSKLNGLIWVKTGRNMNRNLFCFSRSIKLTECICRSFIIYSTPDGGLQSQITFLLYFFSGVVNHSAPVSFTFTCCTYDISYCIQCDDDFQI